MLSTLPDIFNDYRDSLTRHSGPSSFTYFTYGTLTPLIFTKYTEFPKYDIWNTPIFNHQEILNDMNDSLTVSDCSLSSSPESTPDISSESSPSTSSDDIFIDSSESPPSTSSDDIFIDSSDSSDSDNSELLALPTMEPIVPYRRLNLTPSCFLNGCICGHKFEFRDMAYESRKRRNIRSNGVTIRPKTPPINAKLRRIP
jgi:hypothetical protein